MKVVIIIAFIIVIVIIMRIFVKICDAAIYIATPGGMHGTIFKTNYRLFQTEEDKWYVVLLVDITSH